MKNKEYHSRLAKKITIRFLLVEAAMIAGVFILFFAFMLPQNIKSESEKNSYIAANIGYSFDNQMESMVSFSDGLINSNEFKELVSAYDKQKINAERVNLFLNAYSSRYNLCKLIVVRSDGAAVFNSITGIDTGADKIFEDARYKKIEEGSISACFTKVYFDEEKQRYTLAYSSTMIIGGNRYIVTLYSDVSSLMDTLNSNTMFDDIALYDCFGNNLYVREDINNFSDVDVMHTIKNNERFDEEGGYRVNVYGSDRQCIITCYAATGTFIKNMSISFITIIILIFIMIFAGIVILLPMLSKSINPLQKLYKSMKGVAQGENTTLSVIRTKDEIEDLSTMYISMLDNIKKNTELLVEKEKEKDKLQFSLLVDQINPHFIFNTMNIINSLARQNRTEEIISINGALIKLLQDRLRLSVENVCDTIEHELAVLDAYMEIVKFRSSLEVNYLWECKEELRHKEIPKNILQPFVENSLFHGLYDMETGIVKGHINITFKEKGDFMFIDIADDGTGISDEAKCRFYEEAAETEKTRGKHVGMLNVKKRLLLVSPDITEPIELLDNVPKGAIVRIKIKKHD